MFKGCATALVTPMNENGIDYNSLKNILKMQISGGVSALVVNGTTGESSTLTKTEKMQLLEFVNEYINTNAPQIVVIAGVASNDTYSIINEIKSIEELGVFKVMVVTPFYNKTSQAGLVAHYEAIANAVSSKILLYNVPGRTGVNMSVETVLKLSEHPGIVGIKEASGNMSYFAQLASRIPEGFSIFCGNDDLNHMFLTSGAQGMISVMSNAFPDILSEQCKHVDSMDWKSSLTIQNRIWEITDAVFSDVNPIGIKALLSIMGLCENWLRLPLVPMSSQNTVRLRQSLERLLP